MVDERMEEKILIVLIVENIMALICFTALAIVFKHWWIVFLSALFMNDIKKNNE